MTLDESATRIGLGAVECPQHDGQLRPTNDWLWLEVADAHFRPSCLTRTAVSGQAARTTHMPSIRFHRFDATGAMMIGLSKPSDRLGGFGYLLGIGAASIGNRKMT